MQSSPKPEKPGIWLKVTGLSLGLMLANLAGCKSNQHKPDQDPLFGVPKVSTIPPANNTTTTKIRKGAVPPLPVTQTSATTASLATLPGDENRQLAIAPPTPGAPIQWAGNVPTGTLTSQPGAFPPPQTALAPKVSALPKSEIATPLTSVGSLTTNAQTVDLLQAQLRVRGVQYQKQETVPEGVRFTCIAPKRNDPSSSQIYEAVAPDFPSAVQAILLQIDQQP